MFTQVTNAEGQGDNSIQCHHTQPPGIFAQVLLAYASCQNHVKAPSMVGPTWTKVRFALGSDCLPALSQGTTSLLPHVSWTAYCLHAHDSMIWVIQGCISTLYLSMSPWGLFYVSYSVCQEAALTRHTAWRHSRGGVGLGPSGKQLHPATPELTAWQERPADSLQ